MPTGPITKAADYYTGAGYGYSRSSSSIDDLSAKGTIYQAMTRFQITDLCVYLNNLASGTFNYELQLYRASTQKNGSGGAVGMITEHLETISAVSTLTDVDGWVTLPLVSPHHFEVGEYFVVRMVDLETSTNPQDQYEGRTFWINSFNDEPEDLFANRKFIARRMYAWSGGSTTLNLGDTNPTSSGYNFHWGVDFHALMY